MKIAVRYYSRSGNTRRVAEAIAEAAGVTALSTDAQGAGITEAVDILFLGSALYAHGLDKHMKAYLAEIDGSKIGKAVLFSTSMFSKHAFDLMKKALEGKGVKVEAETFYSKSKAIDASIPLAKEFAAKFI